MERRKEKTRLVLLDVALGLFYEKGIYWTKIEDITERADVGKGTFYQHFDTKEDLMAELLKRGLDQLQMRMTQGIHSIQPGPEMIPKIVEARLDFFITHPSYLLLFHQIRGLLQFQSESSKALRDIYSGHLDSLGRLVQPVIDGMQKKGPSARDFAVALAAFTSGLLTYHLIFGKGDTYKQRRTAMAAQISQALLALFEEKT